MMFVNRKQCFSKEILMLRLAPILVVFFWSSCVLAEVIGQEISYQYGDTVMNGYLAYDDAIKGKRPGVVVVHEWWGHNAYVRQRADMLARLGYVALAVDMYGDGKTADHPEDAGKFAGAAKKDMNVAKERFQAALNLLNAQSSTDSSKTAAIGYCFGGGLVLEMARMGVDLDAVASFHGSLGTASPTQSVIKPRILVFNGGADPFVKPEQVAAFKKEMDAAGADYEFIEYPGVKHSFTNPDADEFGQKFNLPLQYDAAADKASWQAMLEMFDSTLK
jgi:dienelactone hydrolase